MTEREIRTAASIVAALHRTGIKIVKTLTAPGQPRFKFQTIRSGNTITDYLDVRFKGYLSTWQSTTPSDRDGDYVLPGAFKDTIELFMRNPVLLLNHDKSLIAGVFEQVREDSVGLYVEARLSNSPAAWVKHARFQVVEGNLRALSMGGMFSYGPDGRGIHKVELYEGSLTPVPSNPDALVRLAR